MKSFNSFSKRNRFNDLSKAVQHCSLCRRLFYRTKVFSHLNGNIDSKVLFIAEAPGRFGADRTGIPLFGDRTGDIFESLISTIGWKREQIFLTNAVLCNPREENGNNGSPTKEEIIDCSPYLEMTIELIQPEVIVPLGKIALDSLSCICPHSLTLKNNVVKLIPWNRRYIFPLYHPSPRALIHRSFIKQCSDYMVLAKIVNPFKGLITKKKMQVKLFDPTTIKRTLLHELVLLFVKQFKEISLFKLTKLLYLTDVMALEKIGRTLSGEIYLRQQEGPWIPNLNKVLKSLKDHQIKVFHKNKTPYVSQGPNCNFKIPFDEESLAVVMNIIERCGHMNESQIKSTTYLTKPMKYILKKEKAGKDMRKIPVIYKNKTAIELDRHS
ncbi:MAG: uracil-DNA glycosylase family protein [Patescibacteria group bacterium]